MVKVTADLRSLAREHTEDGIRTLVHIVKRGRSEAARVSATALLFERGWGKSPQTFGEDGDGSISVIIRHIVESVPAPGQRIIEHAPLANGGDTSADDSNGDA